MAVEHAAPRWSYSKVITPSDVTDNGGAVVGILCNAAGTVSIIFAQLDSSGVQITGTVHVAAGIPLFLPKIARIRSTGTVPTAIAGLIA